MTIGNAGYKIYSQALRTGVIDAIPRNKFNFTVTLTRTGVTEALKLERIANIQMPTFTLRTQTLNKYNNKSIIQTGIDYTPITLTAYDTKDAVFETFLKDYARYYFAGPMNDEDYATWLTSPKGLELREEKTYIKSIKILRHDPDNKEAKLESEIEIFNAYIQNIDTDTLDYSDSGASIIRVTFGYEGYRVLSSNTVMPPDHVNNPNLANEFGLGTDISATVVTETDAFQKMFTVVPDELGNATGKSAGNAENNTAEDEAQFTRNKGAVTSNQPQLERWDGNLKTGEKVRNINGVSYKVPAPVVKKTGVQ